MQVERAVTVTVTNTILKVTAPVMIGGDMAAVGGLVEVSDMEAHDLLGRGKAVPATEAEVSAAIAIAATGTIDRRPDQLTWRAAATWGC